MAWILIREDWQEGRMIKFNLLKTRESKSSGNLAKCLLVSISPQVALLVESRSEFS